MSYSKEFGKWSVKAGLRGEYTSLEGNSVTTSEVNDQNYFKLFPTFYTMYKPNGNHEIGFSYGKRISRPRYSELNPFRIYNNNYSYGMGDPKLLPTIVHNLNFLYTLKGKYNFDLYYRLEKRPIDGNCLSGL
ncbi:TonB-dependent receptor [Flavobacterium lindanitolerans]|nr:TonB-dependent receptor [Flavobacterium lindanitolerans]